MANNIWYAIVPPQLHDQREGVEYLDEKGIWQWLKESATSPTELH